MIENFNLETICFYIAICATVLFVLKSIIFMILGGDAEVHADFNALTDCDISFDFLSIQSILAFCMGFGWIGLTAIKYVQMGKVISIVLALIAGLVFMTISAYLMFVIKKLEKKVVVNYEDYIGAEGKSYTNLHCNTVGQIQIVINNKLQTLNAISLCEEEIKAFSPIKLVKVENNTLYVDRI